METKDEMANRMYRKPYNHLCVYRKRVIDKLYIALGENNGDKT